jgi:PAT family beta-lactamase induction signal transducer AmpG
MLTFGGLYFAQGVPWGFVTVAITLRLTTLGISSAQLGELIFVATLPWIGKPVLGPLVDRVSFGRWGRRKPFVLLAEAGMALTLLAMAFVSPMDQLWWFSALLFLHNVLVSAQDVGTDALAIDLLSPEERGRANGIMSAAKFFGVVVGGQGLLWIAGQAGWPAAYACAIGLLLLPAALVWGLHESPAPDRPRVLRLTLRAFSTRLALLAVGFALLVNLTDAFLTPLAFPLFNRQLGYSEQQIASLATLSSLIGALGSLLGGALNDRMGSRRTILLASLASAGVSLAFAASRGLWGHYGVLVAYTVLAGIASGVLYASTLALYMNLSDPRVAATQFQIYMALFNLKDAYASKWGGRLAERIPATGMFGLAAVLEVLPLILLPWLRERTDATEKAGDGAGHEPVSSGS